jgi:aminoglycoside phosphotransferase (APT) family kinase protein
MAIGREISELQLALRPKEVTGLIASALGEQAADPRRCRVVDVRYEPGERCAILYELGGRLAVGTLSWCVAEADGRRAVPDGWPVSIHAFPEDPALPGLMTAMDPRLMVDRLNRVLPECASGRWRVISCRITPLRYRPNRRCTLSLDAWARHVGTDLVGRRTLVAKVYPTLEKAEAVAALMRSLAELAARANGRLILADVVGVVADVPLVLQGSLEGIPLDRFLRPMQDGRSHVDARGEMGTLLAAEGLADLHRLGGTHGRTRPIGFELGRLKERLLRISAVDRRLGDRIVRVWDQLRASGAPLALEGVRTTLVHGDCKPSQFLLDGRDVGFLDFDHAGMADPALDVGTFLASLRQLGSRGRLKARGDPSARRTGVECLEVEFLDAYVAAAAEDGPFRLRARWYESFALLRKARRAFLRSVRSPLPQMLVDEASLCLKGVKAGT